MGFLDRIRAFTKSRDANWFVNFMQLAAEEDTAQGATVGNAYSKVAWVNIAVSVRARNIARTKFELYRGAGDTMVEEGREWDLFNRSAFGRSGIWEQTEGWRCIRGEAIWILEWGGRVGFPTDFFVVDPALMKHKVDPSRPWVATIWEYTPSHIPFMPEEILHFPVWTPNSMIRGESPWTSLADEVSQEYQSAKGQNRLLANNSVPGGVITIPGDEMSEEQAQRTIERWEKRHQGQSRAGRVAILGSGATYQRISLTPQEQQSMENRGWNRDTILAKLGVPQAAVGLKSATSTLSGKDTAEQMKAFWELTLIPEINYFQDKVNQELFGRFKVPMTCEFDLSGIYELQTDEDLLSNRLRADVQAGVLTINEAREIRGMDPVAWGDVWWAPISLTPVEDSVKEPPPESAPLPAEPSKAVEALFAKGWEGYSKEYRDAHWKATVAQWESVEKQYTKALKEWGFKQRGRMLGVVLAPKAVKIGDVSGIDPFTGGDLFDQESDAELRAISKKYFVAGMEMTEAELKVLFKDLGLGISFNIWDTRAVQLLEMHVNKIVNIEKTVEKEIRGVLREGIEGGWSEEQIADGIREKWNIFGNRAATIARTELGNVINDSREESFKYVGYERQEWLSAKDELVRPSHQIDGEEVQIGQAFSNGLKYPNDPDGPAEEVINCRCLALPVPKD